MGSILNGLRKDRVKSKEESGASGILSKARGRWGCPLPAHRRLGSLAESELRFCIRTREASTRHFTHHPHALAGNMKRKLNDDDVPEPVKKQSQSSTGFVELGLDSRLLQAVNREKFAAPTPIQQQAIPVALQGKDILGI